MGGGEWGDVCVDYCRTYYKAVCGGGRGTVKDMGSHEKEDTQAESSQQLPLEHRQWTTRTQTMTYEWRDNDGVKHVTAWSKAVRSAMLRGGAEHQMQRALNRAVDNWIKIFMLSTNSGLQRIKQATNTGAQSDLMDLKFYATLFFRTSSTISKLFLKYCKG